MNMKHDLLWIAAAAALGAPTFAANAAVPFATVPVAFENYC